MHLIQGEKVRSRVQAAEMGFLPRISGLTLLDKVKSADIRESLNIESLLLRLERSQLRWYGHVTQMSQERTAKKLLCSTPIGRRPRGRPRTRWRDYVEDLSWSRLDIPAEHLSNVAEDRDAWRIQLELLPPWPPKDKRVQKIDWLIDLIQGRNNEVWVGVKPSKWWRYEVKLCQSLCFRLFCFNLFQSLVTSMLRSMWIEVLVSIHNIFRTVCEMLNFG